MVEWVWPVAVVAASASGFAGVGFVRRVAGFRRSAKLKRTEELSAVIQDPARTRVERTAAHIEMLGDYLSEENKAMLWRDAIKQDTAAVTEAS